MHAPLALLLVVTLLGVPMDSMAQRPSDHRLEHLTLAEKAALLTGKNTNAEGQRESKVAGSGPLGD